MKIDAILEYNEKGCLLWAEGYPGAFSRGKTASEAVAKLPAEVASYLLWAHEKRTEFDEVSIVFEKKSQLNVEDADSDLLFPSERLPMDMAEYIQKKELALRSAHDFSVLYLSVPQRKRALVKSRPTFYGRIPQSAEEMLNHTNSTLAYYAAGVGVDFECLPDFERSRLAFFRAIEQSPDLLQPRIFIAEDGEEWTVKKLMRRLIWHDRIHARALYRKAVSFWGKARIANPFGF
ncbi:MAG: hypothetical protein Q4C04_03850 [Clostridia bacterium]|nr:hypothetical protein [Clostridia bacterium]